MVLYIKPIKNIKNSKELNSQDKNYNLLKNQSLRIVYLTQKLIPVKEILTFIIIWIKESIKQEKFNSLTRLSKIAKIAVIS